MSLTYKLKVKIEKIYPSRLYSVVYPDRLIHKWDKLIKNEIAKDCKGLCEYDRLWVLWTNPNYLFEYFSSKKDYLDGPHYNGISVVKAGDMTATYINPFFDLLDSDNLDDVFKTLQNEVTNPTDNRYKHKIKETEKEKNWLRIYAIKIDPGVYIITGGAIKLWKDMDQDDVTKIELKKIQMVQNYLKSEKICGAEELEAYILEVDL